MGSWFPKINGEERRTRVDKEKQRTRLVQLAKGKKTLFMTLNEVCKKRIIETRKASSLKVIDALRSPFRGNNINATEKVDAKERQLFHWLLHGKNQDTCKLIWDKVQKIENVDF